MTDAPPRIGNYVLLKTLGEGGMGRVYLGEHPNIGLKVAIKVLHRGQDDTSDGHRRFRDEARLLVKLKHPNIVQTSDYGTTEQGQLYYVMEYLEGRHLREVINEQKRFTAAEALPYLEQLCNALSAAHRLGVVHRDLKPDNIFITEVEGEPRIKLLDFGLALMWQALGDASATRTGDLLGSPLTISPEQAAGLAKRVNRRSDIYSLGATIYWMLAGHPPFLAKEPGRLLAMHLNDKAPDLGEVCPEIPAGVSKVVMRCLEKEPGDRPPSADAVHRAYVNALEGKEPFPPGERDEGTLQGYADPVARQAPTTIIADSLSTLRRLVHGPRWWVPALALLGLAALAALALLTAGDPGRAPAPMEPIRADQAPAAKKPAAPPPDLTTLAPDSAPPQDMAPEPPAPAIKRPQPRPRPKPAPEKKRKILGEGILDEF